MNDTNVSNLRRTRRLLWTRLAGEFDDLTPEARKAATYVLENPKDVGRLDGARDCWRPPKVKPNTVVRMARQVGLRGL